MSDAPQEFLADLERRVEAVTAAAREEFGPLTPRQLAWPPDPDSWSIGQCLGHLVLMNERYLRFIEPRIEEGRAIPGGAEEPYRPGLIGGRVVAWMGPGGGMRVKTPRIFRPEQAIPASAVDDFADHQERFAGVIRSARGVSLNRVRVRSPASPLLTFRLGDILAILVAHERRHLEQARAIRWRPAFPEA